MTTVSHDTPADPDYTPVSAMSLRELRAEMLERAAMLAAQSRTCRASGQLRRAHTYEVRAQKLMKVARSVNVD